MFEVLSVGAGGALGCIIRYLTTKISCELMPGFPWGTLFVNAAAGLAMGMLMGLTAQTDSLSERTRLFVVVGIIGGMSTYSAFSAETFSMLQEHQYLLALGNIFLNTSLSLSMVALGWWLMTSLVEAR
ncbi:MAG: fluoride efflux transporter CrcB [Coriobacteriales bacterium]|jgi:CrcB protein|nr:fluoride efflux transporter CrcB [Coriobacteriales bacterium]